MSAEILRERCRNDGSLAKVSGQNSSDAGRYFKIDSFLISLSNCRLILSSLHPMINLRLDSSLRGCFGILLKRVFDAKLGPFYQAAFVLALKNLISQDFFTRSSSQLYLAMRAIMIFWSGLIFEAFHIVQTWLSADDSQKSNPSFRS